MANRDLINAFDDCIDRLNEGESLDSILADYPHDADYLRQLLMLGDGVYQAHQTNGDALTARERGRAKLMRAMSDKPKRKPIRNTRNWFLPLSAVATLTLLIIGGALLLPSLSNATPTQLTSTAIALANSTGEGQINQTAIAMAPTVLPPTATPIGIDFFELTATQPVLNATQTSVPLIVGATSFPTLTSTPVPNIVVGATGTPFGIPSVTATGTPTPLPSATALGTMAPEIVPTSIADMPESTLPPTWTPAPGSGGGTTTGSTGLPDTGGGTTGGGGGLPPSGTAVAVVPATMMPPTLPAQPQLNPLNAGEIDDNAMWDNYLRYRNNFLQTGISVNDVDVTNRKIITVTDAQGLPLLGATVQIFDEQTLIAESTTYADGRTLFFPNRYALSANTQSYRLVVRKDNAEQLLSLDPNGASQIGVQLTDVNQNRQNVTLDVLFLLDATGSMADEIQQLQNNLLWISSQIDALGGVNVRYGLVTYRDRGDAYVTQSYEFTPDVNIFQASLNSVRADGGGDTPESLNEALHQAVQNMAWRDNDTVKLVFLVADAPPHLDYPDDFNYAEEMLIALANGIKIHPIASSGLDQQGEYIFRQIAQTTFGHFIFLTYDGGVPGTTGDDRPDLGVGNPDSADGVLDGDGYTVERLDEIVLRLITDELAILRGE